MNTAEVLYTRSFTGYEPVQSEHVLQYAITQDEKEAQISEYGICISCLSKEGKKTENCRAVCKSFRQANDLLRFLWENGVEPGSAEGIIQDIHRAVTLSQKETETSGKNE